MCFRILLEGRNGSILYTGDTRAEADFVQRDLEIIKRRRIQNLYMDTTCARESANKFVSKVTHLGYMLMSVELMYLDNADKIYRVTPELDPRSRRTSSHLC